MKSRLIPALALTALLAACGGSDDTAEGGPEATEAMPSAGTTDGGATQPATTAPATDTHGGMMTGADSAAMSSQGAPMDGAPTTENTGGTSAGNVPTTGAPPPTP